MKGKTYQWRFFYLGFLIPLLLWSNSPASDRILVVHSYHPGYKTWVREIDKAIKKELDAEPIEYQFFYMDTKRHPDEQWKIDAAQKAKTLIDNFKPKVVIAVDDNAQEYLVKNYLDNSKIQFVFCGVNAEPKKYGYPAANVTGILERTYPIQTLEALNILLPNIRRVAVVSDRSPTSQFVISRIEYRQSITASDINITKYVQPSTFSQWKNIIIRMDKDVRIDAIMIPRYHTLRQDGTVTSKEPSEVLAWTLANTRKPVVGLFEEIIQYGGLLSVTVAPREHGRVAARMALEIVAGKKASEIPMQVNKDGYLMINLKKNGHLPLNVNIDIDLIADLVIR